MRKIHLGSHQSLNNKKILIIGANSYLAKEVIKITKTGIERLGSSVINLANYENLMQRLNTLHNVYYLIHQEFL